MTYETFHMSEIVCEIHIEQMLTDSFFATSGSHQLTPLLLSERLRGPEIFGPLPHFDVPKLKKKDT
jgi:hypothetical protein